MPKSPGSPVPGRRPPTLDSFTQGPWTFSTVKVNLKTKQKAADFFPHLISRCTAVSHPDLRGRRHPVWGAHTATPPRYALPTQQAQGLIKEDKQGRLVHIVVFGWKSMISGDTSERSHHWVQSCAGVEKGVWDLLITFNQHYIWLKLLALGIL